MSHFEGDRSVALPPSVVGPKLSNAGYIVGCLKNVEQVVESSPDRAVWKLRTGFTFLSTTLEITLEVMGRTDNAAIFRATSRGVGATSVVQAVLTFQPADSGTTIHYTADILERTGLLKLVSAGLIQSAAKSVIEDTWKMIEARLLSGQ
jgi:carbon monoxide dehydrogenase subunit G